MPSRDADGVPYRSKIASIQEYSNFPASDHALGAEEIDLPVRDGFALHTLVGLNVFLVKIAQQFPDVLGIATQDPMLGSLGQEPLVRTEQAMLDLASEQTAALAVDQIDLDATRLRARVIVTNKTGHKFPSGVGFRRAFVTFRVLDENGKALWVSAAPMPPAPWSTGRASRSTASTGGSWTVRPGSSRRPAATSCISRPSRARTRRRYFRR